MITCTQHRVSRIHLLGSELEITGDIMEKVNEIEAIKLILKSIFPVCFKLLCIFIVMYVSKNILPLYIHNQVIIDIVSFLLMAFVGFFLFRKRKPE
ncbi:hypothetical protein A6833_27615 [Salmonella enterica]|uniref:Uncharacterized protein n=2 Tax=Salmonella enterica TaxID=28901 RepID=A0A3F3IUG1_SALER|nr:hypothetical protein [Salmonella enterica]EAA7933194.1 hypothetical protein [Salmonella enterica subsp. enterica serovar Redlands]EAB9741954.1 hypothetical protein [Salmonella enterica subsp. diarizonae]EAS9239106.1 hypothetical protein [Salmonella enterica subsp. enterica]EBW8698205.1 hypothetical protein [Salmonella enterica subsp. diarizonae serovar 16:z10:e,n,x,z15]ECG1720827.1 hypothetical protein [Salmonella enterica subsp. diarizonae serovar 17:z10:e,n,x,z15]ECT9718722.1 hypothetica